MKTYPHLFSLLFYEPLLITREKHAAIVRYLESRLAEPEGGRSGRRGIRLDDDRDAPREPTPEEDARRMGYNAVGSTAIIRVEGPIGKHLSAMDMMSGGGCDLDNVDEAINLAKSDRDIRRLLFDFRTPGGSSVGVLETGRKIAGIVSKETVAFTDSQCCSAGLWLASQCQQFYTTSSAKVGSIGVWCAYMDLSRQMAMDGENMQAFSAGKHKLMGAYWKPLDDEEKALIQSRVDKLFVQFKEEVQLHREIEAKYMEGQTFDGDEALEIGMTDGLVDSISELVEEEEG